MGSPFGDFGETIFEDKSVLTENYQPEEILEREEEIEEYRYALQDVLFGRDPDNIMLYGKAGLGKTAVTTYMMGALEEEVEHRPEADELHVHSINCNGKSLFLVVRTIVNELLPEHASDFPKRGLGTGDAFEELYKQLNRVEGTHLLVFDEIDHLGDADTLLYELPRAKSNGHIPDAKVGVIGISNNYTFRNSLSAKVKDTLMETEISFSPYDAGELRTILTDRAERALVDGGYDDSAIAKAGAIAAKDMGNARQAIDLLRVGAEVTERSSADTVTDTQITEAQRIVQRGRLRNRISDQTQHAQYILEAMARLAQRGELPTRSRVVQTAYEEIADSYGADPLTSLKSVQNHLSDLHMLGFLQREDQNHGEGGGRYYEYEMDLDPEVVLEAREEIEEAERMH